MSLEPGDRLPELALAANGGRSIALHKDYKGKKLVVYFYPKDNTPGCTLHMPAPVWVEAYFWVDISATCTSWPLKNSSRCTSRSGCWGAITSAA